MKPRLRALLAARFCAPNAALRAAGQPILMGALLFGALTMSCQPSIGDSCLLDADCSQIGDRICDSTQPGGYCTQFNCDPTSCPEGESICIAFSNTPSTALSCGNVGRTSPYVRNFCMKTCKADRNCRDADGYVCTDMAEDNPWGAEVIQENPKRTTVCVLPSSAAPVPLDQVLDYEENVCSGASLVSSGGAGGAAN